MCMCIYIYICIYIYDICILFVYIYSRNIENYRNIEIKICREFMGHATSFCTP